MTINSQTLKTAVSRFTGSALLTLCLWSSLLLLGSSSVLLVRTGLISVISEVSLLVTAVRFLGLFRAVSRYSERLYNHNLVFHYISQVRDRSLRQLKHWLSELMESRSRGLVLSRFLSAIGKEENRILFEQIPLLSLLLFLLSLPFLLFFPPGGSILPVFYAVFACFAFGFFLFYLVEKHFYKHIVHQEEKEESQVFNLFYNWELIRSSTKAKLFPGENLLKKLSQLEFLQSLKNHSLVFFTPLLAGLFFIAIERFDIDFNSERSKLWLYFFLFVFVSTSDIFQDFSKALSARAEALENRKRLPSNKSQSSSSAILDSNKYTGNLSLWQFDNLHLRRNNKTLFPPLSFTWNSREMLTIVGPSGVGKSSLLTWLLGELPHKSAYLKIDGQAIDTSSSQWRDLFSWTDQHIQLIQASVEQNLRLFCGDYNKEQAATLFEQVNLADLFKENPVLGSSGRQLSGGEKKRFAFIRSILTNKKILIFDEIFSELDTENREQMLNILENYKGIKIIVTHQVSRLEGRPYLLLEENKSSYFESGREKEAENQIRFYLNIEE